MNSYYIRLTVYNDIIIYIDLNDFTLQKIQKMKISFISSCNKSMCDIFRVF